MFKNMKLSAKITLGFASLIIIAISLGGLACWSMMGVKTTAVALAEELVPEVTTANEIERASLLTMYAARGYIYSEESHFLEDARKSLAHVKESIQETKDHALKYNDALALENTDKAMARALEYEKLLEETVKTTEALIAQEEKSLVAADKYMKVCAEFLEGQKKAMEGEFNTINSATTINGKEQAEKLRDRLVKITLCNDVIDIGNAICLGTWHAIAKRDPEMFKQARKLFDNVNAKLDELKAITKQEVNLKQIEECRADGAEYAECMDTFLENWLAREELNKTRGVVENMERPALDCKGRHRSVRFMTGQRGAA